MPWWWAAVLQYHTLQYHTTVSTSFLTLIDRYWMFCESGIFWFYYFTRGRETARPSLLQLWPQFIFFYFVFEMSLFALTSVFDWMSGIQKLLPPSVTSTQSHDEWHKELFGRVSCGRSLVSDPNCSWILCWWTIMLLGNLTKWPHIPWQWFLNSAVV